MGRANQIRHSKHQIFFGRLDVENIQSRSSDVPAFQRRRQSNFIDQAAACAVHNHDALFHFVQGRRVNDVRCFRRFGHVQRDNVSAGEQFIQGHLFYAQTNRTFFGQEGIVNNHLQLQTQGLSNDNRTNIAGTDHTQRFTGQLHPLELALFPLPFMRGDIGLRDVSGDSKHHGNGVFGRGDGVAIGRVHHDHTLCATAFDINIVNADTRASYHL